jgi:hypothetical protein
LRDLGTTLKPCRHPSLFAYLGSSMFYRDALNGIYAFGGIYAAGVLGWSIVQIGVFGIPPRSSGRSSAGSAGGSTALRPEAGDRDLHPGADPRLLRDRRDHRPQHGD